MTLSRRLTLSMYRSFSLSRMVSRRILNRRADFALVACPVLLGLGKRFSNQSPQRRVLVIVEVEMGGRLIIFDCAALNVLRG